MPEVLLETLVVSVAEVVPVAEVEPCEEVPLLARVSVVAVELLLATLGEELLVEPTPLCEVVSVLE